MWRAPAVFFASYVVRILHALSLSEAPDSDNGHRVGPPFLSLRRSARPVDPVALAEPDEKLSEDIDERQPTPLTTNVSIVFNVCCLCPAPEPHCFGNARHRPPPDLSLRIFSLRDDGRQKAGDLRPTNGRFSRPANWVRT